jgi:hypothetical protein
MVITTSAACTLSVVSGLGNSREMSEADLGHGGDDCGVELVGGL